MGVDELDAQRPRRLQCLIESPPDAQSQRASSPRAEARRAPPPTSPPLSVPASRRRVGRRRVAVPSPRRGISSKVARSSTSRRRQRARHKRDAPRAGGGGQPAPHAPPPARPPPPPAVLRSAAASSPPSSPAAAASLGGPMAAKGAWPSTVAAATQPEGRPRPHQTRASARAAAPATVGAADEAELAAVPPREIAGEVETARQTTSTSARQAPADRVPNRELRPPMALPSLPPLPSAVTGGGIVEGGRSRGRHAEQPRLAGRRVAAASTSAVSGGSSRRRRARGAGLVHGALGDAVDVVGGSAAAQRRMSAGILARRRACLAAQAVHRRELDRRPQRGRRAHVPRRSARGAAELLRCTARQQRRPPQRRPRLANRRSKATPTASSTRTTAISCAAALAARS